MGQKALEVKRRLEAERAARATAELEGESGWLLGAGLRTIEEARAQIPTLGWKLAQVVRERVDPHASAVNWATVEKANAVLALFHASGEPKPSEDVLAIARAQAELESAVKALLGGQSRD